jgi:hypothetical protein
MLLGIATVAFLLSFFNGIFIKYKLLSLFYMLPFLLLMFRKHPTEKDSRVNHLSIFITSLTIFAVINNFVGLVQVLITPKSDDSFVGIYSEYSISINGLMLLNTVLFFYYFAQFMNEKKFIHAIPALFFLVCAFLGYYGAGLVIFAAAFILTFFRFRLKAIIRTTTIAVSSLAILIVFLYIVKPLVLEYNIANIKKLMTFDPNTGARKVRSFYNYGISYPRDAKDFLFGSGPGTFNSRSAFMVGSPSYFQLFPFIKDDKQPYYFENFAYTLWNSGNTQKELYLDGFRNQPFSSLLAFLGEYGLIFTLFFFYLYLAYYRSVTKTYNNKKTGSATAKFRFFKFLMILLPLLLLIDNYYEYPEVMLLVILGIKFAHASIEQEKLNPL